MKRKIITVLITIFVLLGNNVYAGLQKETPYKPPSAKEYQKLKTIFANLTNQEINQSIQISQDLDIINLTNSMLVYLKYKKLIKQTKKLPHIFFLYSNNNHALEYANGMYYSNENIIVLNATILQTNNIVPNNLPKHMQQAIDFVTFASILSHELMHYEDYVDASEIYSMDAGALSEWNAYKRSEKVIEYFTNMPKAEAEEIIYIPHFYDSLQMAEDYFVNVRKNYIKIVDAANVFLNNEDKICKMLGFNKDKFKMLSFSPHIMINEKNGGHIVRVKSTFLDLPQILYFDINILSGTLKLVTAAEKVAKFKKQAIKIKMIDKNTYTIVSP